MLLKCLSSSEKGIFTIVYFFSTVKTEVRMVCVKNYENMSAFVKVITSRLLYTFSVHGVLYTVDDDV